MLDPSTVAYSAAMTTPLTAPRQVVVNELVRGLKTDGVWSNLDWLLLLAQETDQGSRVNLINAAKIASAVNGPTFTADRGWTGNGSNAHLDCGEALAVQSKYSLNSAHAGFVVNQQNSTAAVGPVGLSLSSAMHYVVRGDGSNALFFVNDTTSDIAHAAMTSKLGHFVGVRQSATSKKAFKNGALSNAYTSASTSVGTGNITVLRRTSLYSPDRVSAFHLGAALTDAQVAALHARLNTYLTAIGGQ